MSVLAPIFGDRALAQSAPADTAGLVPASAPAAQDTSTVGTLADIPGQLPESTRFLMFGDGNHWADSMKTVLFTEENIRAWKDRGFKHIVIEMKEQEPPPETLPQDGPDRPGAPLRSPTHWRDMAQASAPSAGIDGRQ